MQDALPRGGRFATTQWSIVLSAGRRSAPDSEGALSALCETYWSPVYFFVRRQGHDPDAARDLTQEFFARVLEKNYFAQADPDRGRFRTFLLACVRHFLSNERERQQAQKRGGKAPPISLEAESAEGLYEIEVPDDRTPEKVFDARWAAILLSRALARVEADYAADDRSALFAEIRGHLTGDGAPDAHATAAHTLGMSEGAIRVAVHRLRKRFREALLEEISATVARPEDVDGEVRHLLRAVSV